MGQILNMTFQKRHFYFHYSTAKSRVESNLPSENHKPRYHLKVEEGNTPKRHTRYSEPRYANSYL